MPYFSTPSSTRSGLKADFSRFEPQAAPLSFSSSGRVKRGRPCPVCEGKDWCTFDSSGLFLICMRKSQPPFGWVLLKTTSDGGWLYKSEDLIAREQLERSLAKLDRIPKAVAGSKPIANPNQATATVAEVTPQVSAAAPAPQTLKLKTPLASEAERVAALNFLLSRLTLSSEHESYLAQEGFDRAWAEELGYRTLPAVTPARNQLLNELDKQFGRTVTRTLGFVYERSSKGGGAYLCFAAVPRDTEVLLFPIRNQAGQPIALKARWLEPEPQATNPVSKPNQSKIQTQAQSTDGQGNKVADSRGYRRQYRVMSAGNTEMGANVGVPVHVARPPFGQAVTPGLEDWLIVTEGERKADYIAQVLGLTVLGVQGVTNWRAGGLLPILAQLGIKTVVEAYDADQATNPKVQKAAHQLAEQLAGAGYQVFQARWPLDAGKGLDDYLRLQSQSDDTLNWPDLHRFGPLSTAAGSNPSATATATSFANATKGATTSCTKTQAEAQAQAEATKLELAEFKRRYGIDRRRIERIKQQYVILQPEALQTALSQNGPTSKFGTRAEAAADPDRQVGVGKANDRPATFEFYRHQAQAQTATQAQAQAVGHETGKLSLQQVRARLQSFFFELFAEHARPGVADEEHQDLFTLPGRKVFLRVTTGGGKSQAAHNQFEQHLDWHRPGRVLYLTQTKQAYTDLIQPGGQLYPHYQSGRVFAREGRSSQPGSPYYCKRYDDCSQVGQSRNPASADVCGTCPFGSEANWQKYAKKYGFDPEQTPKWLCNEKGYLATVEKAKRARVVLAPMASYFNASNELAEFDYIIIDEDCTQHLVERQRLGFEQLAVWQEARRRLEHQAQHPEEYDQDEQAQEAAEEEDGYGYEREYAADDHLPSSARAYSHPEEKEKKSSGLSLAELQEQHAPFDRLGQLLEATLRDFLAADQQAGRAPLLELLSHRAAQDGLDLGQLLIECQAVRPSLKFGRYAWERPYRSGPRLISPLRFVSDLLDHLTRSLADRAKSATADKTLWLERQRTPLGMQAFVLAYLPRQLVIANLRGQELKYRSEFKRPPAVVFMDATAGPLLSLAMGEEEELEQLNLEIEQHLEVTQVTDSLYTAQSLQRPTTMKRINRTIEAVQARYASKNTVTFSRKQFNPTANETNPIMASKLCQADPPAGSQASALTTALALPLPLPLVELAVELAVKPKQNEVNSAQGLREREKTEEQVGDRATLGYPQLSVKPLAGGQVRYGHYERHNKGLNQYAEAELLVVTGYFMPQIEDTEAVVMALRQRKTAPDALAQNARYRLRAYNWQNRQSGEGLARWCKAHPDPQINAVLEHQYWASVMQTIGRGRAALRSPDQPLKVLLLTAMPVAGLPISLLTSTADLLQEAKISQRQLAALAAGREAHNQAVQAETVQRIEETRQSLAAEGQEWVAPGRFAQAAGVSRSVLYQLGYAGAGRWVRVGAIPEVFSQEIYISKLYQPAITLPEYVYPVCVPLPLESSGSARSQAEPDIAEAEKEPEAREKEPKALRQAFAERWIALLC